MKLATAFSGIGAIEHAFLRQNIEHEIVFACDNDRFVKESYFANYTIDEKSWYDDVKDIDGTKYHKDVDLLVAGTPCQSFSIVGKRKGLGDQRGNLVYEFIRLIKEVQPRFFIFENVKGLLSHDSGKTWESLTKSFQFTGYNIKYKVLNSKNYGIPQNRERLFVVGWRDIDVDFNFPKPIKLTRTMADFLEDSPKDKFNLPPKGVSFVTNPKNLKKKYTQINGDIALCQKANQQFNWHGDFVISMPNSVPSKYTLSQKVQKYVLASGTKNFYSKPEVDLDIARPLTATMHKMHRAGVDNYVSLPEGTLRKLTPRECLRLMGFDDRFKIVVSDTQIYRQAGNSVVVDVLISLLSGMLEFLEQHDK